MTFNGTLQLLLYMVVLIALAKPLGGYMARVYDGQPLVLNRVLGPLERLIYRLCGVRAGHREADMDWKTYAIAMMLFNLLGFLVVYALQRFQGLLPLNPQGFGAVTPDSSFNTATSFATNTNWQGYGGETTMSYLTQMLALTVQNFVSAASGMATLVAFIRGLARHSAQSLGNFWEDLTRSILYILLPLSVVLALFMVSQGTTHAHGGAGAPDQWPTGVRGCLCVVAGGTLPNLGLRRQACDRDRDGQGAGAAHGASSLTDRHQAARHQRRRVLQCQLGTPV